MYGTSEAGSAVQRNIAKQLTTFQRSDCELSRSRRSRRRPNAIPPEVESRAIALYDQGRVSRNLAVPASAAPLAGHSWVLLASAVMTHVRSWPTTTLPPPTALSLLPKLSLDIAADGVLSFTSLLVRVNDAGEFLLGAWDSSTFESFVATLCACAFSW